MIFLNLKIAAKNCIVRSTEVRDERQKLIFVINANEWIMWAIRSPMIKLVIKIIGWSTPLIELRNQRQELKWSMQMILVWDQCIWLDCVINANVGLREKHLWFII